MSTDHHHPRAPAGAIKLSENTYISAPVVLVCAVLYFVVNFSSEYFNKWAGVDQTISSYKVESDRRFAELISNSDKRFVEITTTLAGVQNAMRALADRVDTKTVDRWPTNTMAIWCLQTALVNAHIGFRCVSPYYSKNEDADTGGITTWTATVKPSG